MVQGGRCHRHDDGAAPAGQPCPHIWLLIAVPKDAIQMHAQRVCGTKDLDKSLHQPGMQQGRTRALTDTKEPEAGSLGATGLLTHLLQQPSGPQTILQTVIYPKNNTAMFSLNPPVHSVTNTCGTSTGLDRVAGGYEDGWHKCRAFPASQEVLLDITRQLSYTQVKTRAGKFLTSKGQNVGKTAF